MVSRQRKAISGGSLGLALLLALVFSALSAGAAQAATWKVDGAAFSGEESFASSGGPVTVNMWQGATKIPILCQEVNGEGTIYGGDKASEELSLSNCAVPAAPACYVSDIVSSNLQTNLAMQGSELYDYFDASGIDNLFFLEIQECGLEAEMDVTGTFAGKPSAAGVELVQSPLQFSKTINQAAGAYMHWGGATMALEGKINRALTGAHAGDPWGVS
jgi:hypothetical protein